MVLAWKLEIVGLFDRQSLMEKREISPLSPGSVILSVLSPLAYPLLLQESLPLHFQSRVNWPGARVLVVELKGGFELRCPSDLCWWKRRSIAYYAWMIDLMKTQSMISRLPK